MIKNLLIFIFLVGASMVQASTVSKNVEYGTTEKFEGYLVMPNHLKYPRPGILMIHNWLGITDETKHQAQRYADLGYIVMAADVYGKGIRPKDAQEAGELAGKYKSNRKLLRERLVLAYNKLLQEKNVDKTKIAVIGYCFGGTAALELARAGVMLKGTLSFHGGLDSSNPQDGRNIKGRVIAFHGAMDPYEKESDLQAFENEMKNNNVDYLLVKYEGAVHSFTDKTAGDDVSTGAAYNEEADRNSYETARVFLRDVFEY